LLSICTRAAAFDPWPITMPPLEVVGEFRVPIEAGQSRHFQRRKMTEAVDLAKLRGPDEVERALAVCAEAAASATASWPRSSPTKPAAR
jgi:hypothetical protein